MKWTFLLVFLVVAALATAQTPANSRAEYERNYQHRIAQEYLNQVYVPRDLADAFVQLNKLTDANSRTAFVSLPEEQVYHELFHSLGRWVRLNWGFDGGSRLSHYLRQMGLQHPDDMAEALIVLYHRHLRQQPLDPKPLVTQIIEQRKQGWKSRKLEGKVIESTTRQRPAGGQ